MRESRNVDLRPIYGILLLLHEKFDTLPVGTSCNKKIMQNFASSHIFIRRSVRFDFYVLLLMISPYLFLAVSHGTRRKRGEEKWSGIEIAIEEFRWKILLWMGKNCNSTNITSNRLLPSSYYFVNFVTRITVARHVNKILSIGLVTQRFDELQHPSISVQQMHVTRMMSVNIWERPKFNQFFSKTSCSHIAAV